MPEFLSAESEHLLDWFPLTLRLTVMRQLAMRLPEKSGDIPGVGLQWSRRSDQY